MSEAAGLHGQDATVAALVDQVRAQHDEISELRLELATAQLQLLAVGKLIDVDLAPLLIDLPAVTDSTGRLDPELAATALSALVEAKPYLAPRAGGPPRGSRY